MDDLESLYDQLDAYAGVIRNRDARIAELEAARIAYASEFAPDAEGLPDVGSIHANIRAMKADAERWRTIKHAPGLSKFLMGVMVNLTNEQALEYAEKMENG